MRNFLSSHTNWIGQGDTNGAGENDVVIIGAHGDDEADLYLQSRPMGIKREGNGGGGC